MNQSVEKDYLTQGEWEAYRAANAPHFGATEHLHMLYDGVPICSCGESDCTSLDAVSPPEQQTPGGAS